MTLRKTFPSPMLALLAIQHVAPQDLLKTGALVTDHGQTRTWTQARYVENMFQSGYLLERITEKAPTGTDALDPDVPEQTVEILGDGKLIPENDALKILAAQHHGLKARAAFSMRGWYFDADNHAAAGQIFCQTPSAAQPKAPKSSL